MVGEGANDLIKPLSVGISSTEEALWCSPVLISAALCDESCYMPVLRVDGHRMITMPTVQHCFNCVRRNSRSDLPRALRVVGLPGTVVIDSRVDKKLRVALQSRKVTIFLQVSD